MAFETYTKDCTALSDAELTEMADLAAECERGFDVGLLSKQREEWVLVTLIREGEALAGYCYSTLERIGGTPAVLVGLAYVRRSDDRDEVLGAVMSACYHRALMAFPDEDVLLGCRMVNPGAMSAFEKLEDIHPHPEVEAGGEERQWGRRLAKRFGIGASRYAAKTFTVEGDGSFPPCLDFKPLDTASVDPKVAELFAELDAERGDSLITYGWAMEEELRSYTKPD
ncbi:MAG: hypothetical protein KDB24_17195 [Microthrixaceae bacterium]|nr:hypothetical protein [Microthrixaceae bacterium]